MGAGFCAKASPKRRPLGSSWPRQKEDILRSNRFLLHLPFPKGRLLESVRVTAGDIMWMGGEFLRQSGKPLCAEAMPGFSDSGGTELDPALLSGDIDM